MKSGLFITELSARSALLREVTVRSLHIKEVFIRRDLTVKALAF